ncbi:MAG: glutamate mutase L [Anaerolineaceae bacterium]|nr:glutamate mutase L [Anaerolineaceae bacterium]
MAETKPLSIMTIDIGTNETRAYLFDSVNGRYRILAVGHADSTMDAPFFDVQEGVLRAVAELEKVSERTLIDRENHIIRPSTAQGHGVDRLAMTVSAGPQLKVIAAGLLSDVSVASCRRLAGSVGGRLVDEISLSDRASVEKHLQEALQERPEIILFSGGTEGGATRAVLNTATLIHSVCRLLPDGKRPVVLFVGNQVLAEKVENMLNEDTMVYSVPNIRPQIAVQDLSPAQYELAEIMALLRTQQLGGLEVISQATNVPLMPTSFVFGRVFRYLSQVNAQGRAPILGIDVGSAYTVVASATRGDLDLNVLPYGMGTGAERFLTFADLDDVARWIPNDLPTAMVRDYLYQKSCFPHALPINDEYLAIEQALCRGLIRRSTRQTQLLFDHPQNGYQMIIGAGKALSDAPVMDQSLLMLLDGIQPIGVSTLALDKNGMLSAAGTAAAIEPLTLIHLLDSGALPTLGTVVSPVSVEKKERPIIYGQLLYANGKQLEFEVKKGEIRLMPLAAGETAQLRIHALHRTWLDEDRSVVNAEYRVVGGYCGVVIDGRGRPIELPEDDAERISLLQTWQQAVRAQG